MYVWIHLWVSSTHHTNPSAVGHFLTLWGALKGVQEEGGKEEERWKGEGSWDCSCVPLCSSHPSPSCPQDGGAALEICPVKEIKDVSAKTILQMGINFSHGAPARLVPEELTAHQ